MDSIEIPLTRGYVATIDAADAHLVSFRSWNAHIKKGSPRVYAAGRTGRGTHYDMMHHVILDLPHNVVIDHMDGDGLNNRRDNLRPCTNQQNSFNRKKTAKASSIYKGVRWHNRDRRWIVEVTHNSKRREVGRFKSEEDAARAYDFEANKLFGEFARLNFPCNVPRQESPDGGGLLMNATIGA
jgi:hypothetical protein